MLNWMRRFQTTFDLERLPYLPYHQHFMRADPPIKMCAQRRFLRLRRNARKGFNPHLIIRTKSLLLYFNYIFRKKNDDRAGGKFDNTSDLNSKSESALNSMWKTKKDGHGIWYYYKKGSSTPHTRRVYWKPFDLMTKHQVRIQNIPIHRCFK